MAASDDGAERSHEPTQKRRDEARREGRILASKEAAIFVTMAAATLGLSALPGLGARAAAEWAAHLRLGAAGTLEQSLLPALAGAGWMILVAPLLIAVPMALAAILAQAVMGGLRWTARNHHFRPERLNPLAGLGRMVSVRAVTELVKSFAKVALLGGTAAWLLRGALPQITALSGMPPADAARVIADLVLRLFALLTLGLGLIGAADLLVEWRRLSNSLRMTFDEVKREAKEDNGSPEVKGRQRRLQIEASRRSARERASVAEVPQATAVITNPAHFAVALRYVQGETAAPLILAMGRDATAHRILEQARRHAVPVLPLPPLARALYYTGQIGTPIAEGLYGAVAAILAHLWRLERGQPGDPPEIHLPPELRFNAQGRREV